MEDTEIIALFNGRDQQAIAVTKKKYGPYCYAIALNILHIREDAEECENDTYFAAWRQIPPDQPKLLRAYLGKIARNLSISRYRSLHAAKRGGGTELLLSELEECLPGRETVEDAVEAKELSEHIAQWLMGFSKEDRALFLRRYWYGESISQLSERFHSSNNQISQRLFWLRKGLKAFLEKEGVAL